MQEVLGAEPRRDVSLTREALSRERLATHRVKPTGGGDIVGEDAAALALLHWTADWIREFSRGDGAPALVRPPAPTAHGGLLAAARGPRCPQRRRGNAGPVDAGPRPQHPGYGFRGSSARRTSPRTAGPIRWPQPITSATPSSTSSHRAPATRDAAGRRGDGQADPARHPTARDLAPAVSRSPRGRVPQDAPARVGTRRRRPQAP